MAVKKVLQIGDPRLKEKSVDIVDFGSVKSIIQNLTDTMHDKGLVGISAPQIGENINLFITEVRETETRSNDQIDKLRVFINPRIIEFSKDRTILYEGCGSVMNAKLFAPVERPSIIKIRAFDKLGKEFEMEVNGLLGVTIQHEYDHLFGVEFLEKISDYKKVMTIDFYKKQIMNLDENKKASNTTIKFLKYL